MSEPILSREELQHAARAMLMAVLGAPHDIERNSVKVHFDADKEGHNALNQMSRRIESELKALLEKLRGEPRAWLVEGGRMFRDRAFIDEWNADTSLAERNDGARKMPLYTLKGQS
ncbi:hypothetical protein [Burkholderia mayonis]|uniref:Uncharacterized protein n=1 Tax=Burkholderia mayonis TaxID=1385591 RepID=A0A1B4G383_9BURK|nr:hypothetical protein [Burkholderia mayonis]AOJ10371.1 hypothetical protein WS71_24495 [Burkholderia mayonis]KVE53649.1 hypothetical protein WS71_06285 [Burkholderia mayonis]